jgi:hypothetical protein
MEIPQYIGPGAAYYSLRLRASSKTSRFEPILAEMFYDNF